MTSERRNQLLEKYPSTKALSDSWHGLMAAAPEHASTDREYMAAWRRGFPQTAGEWFDSPWQACSKCCDSSCEGGC